MWWPSAVAMVRAVIMAHRSQYAASGCRPSWSRTTTNAVLPWRTRRPKTTIEQRSVSLGECTASFCAHTVPIMSLLLIPSAALYFVAMSCILPRCCGCFGPLFAWNFIEKNWRCGVPSLVGLSFNTFCTGEQVYWLLCPGYVLLHLYMSLVGAAYLPWTHTRL